MRIDSIPIRQQKLESLRALKQRWAGLFMLSLLLLSTGGLTLSIFWSPNFAARWFLTAFIGVSLLLGTVWKNLASNHPAEASGQVYADLGLPNLVTYWRGFLIACTAGFLFTPRPTGMLVWVPGILFSFGILSDFLDGYLARVSGRSTILGERLDVVTDSMAVLTGTLLAVNWGQAPRWFLLIGFARYFFIFGMWVRKKLGKPNHEMPPSLGRRALAGTMMGFIMVLLWPLFGPPGTWIAAYLFAIPFLFYFLRDWFFVSGVLSADRVPEVHLPDWFSAWIPLILRAIVVISLGIVFTEWIRSFGMVTNLYGILGVQYPILLVVLILLLEAVVILFSALGIMGRTMGVLAICIAGFHLRFGVGLDLMLLAGGVSAGLLIFLGSGKLSFWQPEDELLQRRAGEAN